MIETNPKISQEMLSIAMDFGKKRNNKVGDKLKTNGQ